MKSPWHNFTEYELSCHCGRQDCPSSGSDDMSPVTMCATQEIREMLGFPLPVSSAYRCENHPSEIDKEKPGTHNEGEALDIDVARGQAHALLQMALAFPYIKLIEDLGIMLDQREDEELMAIYYGMLRVAGWNNGYLPPVFTGIGVSQRKGRARFIHLDTDQGSDRLRPTVWSY